ncbi:phosphotyrosine protein phosphatase [Candidatus Woesearchaeota archaeon]|nr:phosphotyrosine protein phosphatase [Candidatus Woesearchaeota archaeon]
MKVLFICNQNENRSKTAEEVLRKKYSTKSAGLFNNNPVSKEELEWADMIAVMEDHQREEIGKRFPKIYLKKKIISLDIPDIYHHNQPELIKILKEKSL